jgi:hypothetical protein
MEMEKLESKWLIEKTEDSKKQRRNIAVRVGQKIYSRLREEESGYRLPLYTPEILHANDLWDEECGEGWPHEK